MARISWAPWAVRRAGVGRATVWRTHDDVAVVRPVAVIVVIVMHVAEATDHQCGVSEWNGLGDITLGVFIVGVGGAGSEKKRGEQHPAGMIDQFHS